MLTVQSLRYNKRRVSVQLLSNKKLTRLAFPFFPLGSHSGRLTFNQAAKLIHAHLPRFETHPRQVSKENRRRITGVRDASVDRYALTSREYR